MRYTSPENPELWGLGVAGEILRTLKLAYSLRRQKGYWLFAVGCAFLAIGVYIYLIADVQAHIGFEKELWAQLATMAAACYAGSAIFGKNFKGLGPIIPAAGSMLCGTAALIPASFVVGRPWILTPSIQSVFGVFYSILVFNVAEGGQWVNLAGQRRWCLGGKKLVQPLNRIRGRGNLL